MMGDGGEGVSRNVEETFFCDGVMVFEDHTTVGEKVLWWWWWWWPGVKPTVG